jgi:hypothetical protein
MAATAAQIAEVRRMVNEPTAATYSDALVKVFVERYPLMDERGEIPYTWDTSTSPPTQDANEDWVATYDLHRAAADIWDEKASVAAQDFDFTADGGQYVRSQVVRQYMELARWHRARRKPGTFTAIMSPEPESTLNDQLVGNEAEPR